MKIKCTRSTVL